MDSVLLWPSGVFNLVFFIWAILHGGPSRADPLKGPAFHHPWPCMGSSLPRSPLGCPWCQLECHAAHSESKVDKTTQSHLCALGRLDPPCTTPLPTCGCFKPLPFLDIVVYVAIDTSLDPEPPFLCFIWRSGTYTVCFFGIWTHNWTSYTQCPMNEWMSVMIWCCWKKN